jgi:hypothetical protein
MRTSLGALLALRGATWVIKTPDALMQLVRNRCGIEGWHWIRDTRLQ